MYVNTMNAPKARGFDLPLRPLVAALASALLSGPVLAATTFTVNDSGDAVDAVPGNALCETAGGVCTLRAAIMEANALSGSDTINFAIGSGAVTISPVSALPTITTPIAINGYSQPGSSANTLAVGSDAVINIRLDGASAGAGVNGLTFNVGSDNSSVRGLAITGFTNQGIMLNGGGAGGTTGYTIAGNFIGTDSAGADLHNSTSGVFVYNNVTNSLIGGANPEDRNVIAGNWVMGISIGNLGSTGNTIRNNYIGVTPSGLVELDNGASGIEINSTQHTTIQDNVIGGNSEGIRISNATTYATITGNKIGVGADGSVDIGGGGTGISIYSGASGGVGNTQIGGTSAGQGNVIANWGGAGVVVNRFNGAYSVSAANSIRGNSIYNNGGLGIDLADTATATGVGTDNANDVDDVDVGANNFQNYPVASTAMTDGASTAVSFTYGSYVLGQFWVDVYSSPTCDGSGHGEGRTYLGTTTITADGSGNASATVTGLPATTVGQFITLTATDTVMQSTSEFSACQTIAAGAAPSAGGAQSIPTLSETGMALMSLLLALVGGLARRFGTTRSS